MANFLDEVISTTKNVAATAGKKTDEAVKYSKLKIKEAQTNSDIKDRFTKLGEMIYQMAKANQKDDEAFETCVAEIDALYDRLTEINLKMDELRQEITCTDCGAKTKNDNSFCPKCGAKLPRPEPKEEASEEENAPEAQEEVKLDEAKAEAADEKKEEN